jgi:hypothetical protein
MFYARLFGFLQYSSAVRTNEIVQGLTVLVEYSGAIRTLKDNHFSSSAKTFATAAEAWASLDSR